MKVVATMSVKDLNAETPIETLEDGSTVERDVRGDIVKIVSAKGKEYTAKNLSAKADAELVKRVENYRWANELTVAELVIKAVEELLARDAS